MACGGDAIHLEAASGLSKAAALKYLHEVTVLPLTELICKQLDGCSYGRLKQFRKKMDIWTVGSGFE
jgi:hypothetical protein